MQPEFLLEAETVEQVPRYPSEFMALGPDGVELVLEPHGDLVVVERALGDVLLYDLPSSRTRAPNSSMAIPFDSQSWSTGPPSRLLMFPTDAVPRR